MTLPLASQVFISHLWQQGNIKSVHLILKRNSRVGWLIMLAGSACLLVIGKPLFEWWLGPGNFIGYAVLGAFLMSETMEVQSYIIASSSRATEDEAFAISAVTGGLAKLGMSWLLAHWLGLFGIALGTVIGLLFTNQWYMTLRGPVEVENPFPRLCPLRSHSLRHLLPLDVWAALWSALFDSRRCPFSANRHRGICLWWPVLYIRLVFGAGARSAIARTAGHAIQLIRSQTPAALEHHFLFPEIFCLKL